MANEKISQLPSAIASSGSDLYPLVKAGANYSITFANLLNSIASALSPAQLPTITLTGDVTGSNSGGTIATSVSAINGVSYNWPVSNATGALVNDGSGNLSWSAQTGGANTALSNLTTTSINQDLVPNVGNTRIMGSASAAWQSLWINEVLSPGNLAIELTTGKFYNNTGSSVVDMYNNLLADNSQQNSIDWQSRLLIDTAGTTQMFWNTAGVFFPTALDGTVAVLEAGTARLRGSSVSITTLGYLDATSSIQTQLNGKQSSGNYITALTGDVTASGPDSATATVNSVGGSTAASVSAAAVAVAAATNLDAPNTLILRDNSAKFGADGITDSGGQNAVLIQVRRLTATNGSSSVDWGGRFLSDGVIGAQLSWDATGVNLPNLTADGPLFLDSGKYITNSGVMPIANGGTNSFTALTNDLVIISSSGQIVESTTTTTQLSYLDATSSIQTQLNSKAPIASPSLTGTVLINANGPIVTGDVLVAEQTGATGASANAVFPSYNSAAGFESQIRLLRARGTQSAPAAIQSGDSIAAVSLGGYDSSVYKNSVNMVASATENWTASTHGTQLSFNAVPTGSNNASLRFSLTGDGFFTINTSKLLAATDGGFDIGQAGAQRIGTLYTKNNVNVGISLVLNGSTSGTITQSAAATTTPYSILWPGAQGGATTYLQNDGSGNLSWVAPSYISSSLLSADIIVGNGSNVATAVSVSGDLSLANTGAFTVQKIQGNVISGTTGAGNVVFATSPTISNLTISNNIGGSNWEIFGADGHVNFDNGAILSNGSGAFTSGVWNATTIAIAHGGTGQVTASAAFNALSPMTTAGDLVYGGASGTGTRLGIGSSGQILTVSGGNPIWATAPYVSTTLNSGQILVGNASNVATAETMSGDGTLSNAGALTITQAGGGTGTFKAGVVNFTQIGINNPNAPSTFPNFTLIDAIGNLSTLSAVVQLTGYGAAGGNIGYVTKRGRGTSTSPSAVVSGDKLALFSAYGYGANQFANASTGAINFFAGETFTNGSNATFFTVETTPTGSITRAERIRINSTGNVLIGTTTDAGASLLLQVGSSGQFQVNSSGNAVKINNITYSWPSSQGSSGTILTNNGSGTLSWAAAPTTGIIQLTGDVTAGPGTGSQASTVAFVDGYTAAAIGTAVAAVQAANSVATVGTIPLIGGTINSTFLCVDMVIGPQGPGNFTTMNLSDGGWLGFDGNTALSINDHYNMFDRAGNTVFEWDTRSFFDIDGNIVAAFEGNDFEFSINHLGGGEGAFGAPTMTPGSALGTGGTASASGGASDMNGNVSCSIGTLPATNAMLFTITFASEYLGGPVQTVSLTAMNSDAAALPVYWLPGSDGTYIEVYCLTTPTPSTSPAWSYLIGQ